MIEVVRLQGDGASRGLAFSRARRQPIRSFLEDWLSSLERGGIADPSAYVERMLAETGFRRSIDELAPGLMAEICAIALGAEVPLEILLGAQLMDEEWAYRGRWGRTAPRTNAAAWRSRKSTAP